jgi:2-dehydro-3-deoxyphosphogluconate aldolase/(4S)-4-hydroxy-2-oxoglutarate aldolase
MNVKELMQLAPVIPVLVIDDVSKAEPLAAALVEGGLPVLEVTMRTPQALDAMAAMSNVPGAIVGVGTALDADDLQRAKDRGARFAVSPGYTHQLGQAARDIQLPLLPGIMSPADIMRARDDGYHQLKFFPASQAGGTALLKGFSGPFIDAVFCPTGGINADTAKDYLALPNVLCVGGSWVAPKTLVDSNDWQAITKLASACGDLTER